MAFQDGGDRNSTMSGQTPATSVRDFGDQAMNVQSFQQATESCALPVAQAAPVAA